MKKSLVLIIALFSSSVLSYADLQSYSVGGAFLSGYNYLHQSATTRAQFDAAVNLDIGAKLSDNLKAFVQLQGGAGHGSLGLVGPGVIVTDLNFTYYKGAMELTMGSFDTPFGHEVKRLTNNADTFQNRFLQNSLFYSALAGNGTLNAIGILASTEFMKTTIDLALTNGTGENAVNESNTHEIVVRLGRSILDGFNAGASYLVSDDRDDTNNANSNSFAADLTAWIVDTEIEPVDNWKVTAYAGNIVYGDGNPATKDDAAFFGIQGETSIAEWQVTGRASRWTPSDNDGNGTGISATLPNPGLAVAAGSFIPVKDTEITRYQLSLGKELEENLLFRIEAILDDYKHGQDVKGVLAYVNGRF